MSENTFTLPSGIEVNWHPVSQYMAELDRPLGERVCRLCCERENGKENARIGIIVHAVCSRGCVFPDDIEAERIQQERFMNAEKPPVTEEEFIKAEAKAAKQGVVYVHSPRSPFSQGTADDKILSIFVEVGVTGIKMGDLYAKTLPFFPDKDEKSIKLVCSGFASRFGKAGNGAGFEVVWDIAPRRGRGSNASERRLAVVFPGQQWPTWAIKKTGLEEE